MNQLHEKGLVEIVPETPLRYRPVPIAKYLHQQAMELKDRAKRLEEDLDRLSMEFAIREELQVEERGRFEAIYGRKNVRERLMEMYNGAQNEIIGIGTLRSPQRITKSAIFTIRERYKAGVSIRYAFPVTPFNRRDVDQISEVAKVRNINVQLPMYFYVFDDSQVILNHPIPDDDNFYRGDDIAIWTNDKAIAGAMKLIAEKIWAAGTEPGIMTVAEPLLEVSEKYLRLLGERSGAVLASLGRQVGLEIGREIMGTSLEEVLKSLGEFWSLHDLGTLEVKSLSPLTLEVDTNVDCTGMSEVGEFLCGFVEEVVVGILEVKLGLRAHALENRTMGPCNNNCVLVLELKDRPT